MSAPDSRRRRGASENEPVPETGELGMGARAGARQLRVLFLLATLAVTFVMVATLNQRIVSGLTLDVDDAGNVVPESRGGTFERWLRSLRGGQDDSLQTTPRPFAPPETVEMDKAQLEAMDSRNRTKLLNELKDGRVLISPSPSRLHGFVGLGSNGKDLWQPQELDVALDQMDMVKELRVGGGFNMKLSDSLPMDRDIVDSRHSSCNKKWDYGRLPSASVVIIFYNEPRSTLFRSIHSVFNLTPPNLLDKIILVDDGSSLEWITNELPSLVAKYPKIVLHRLEVRSGIVKARTAGIQLCNSPIFVVLDSHIEVQPGWLEPLVQRIAEDRTAVVMPQVDSLDAETFTYHSGGIGCTLGFLWRLIEHSYIPSAELKSPTSRINPAPNDPVTSPTMAGGLFAANKDFFVEEIGGYDEGFVYWGTENLELSFRLWQCGGRLECIPCSRVYHIFRKGGVGYSSPRDSVTRNKLRLMSVWMDEYADLAYKSIGEPTGVDYGEIDSLKLWKSQKKCKSFQWFLQNVYPESHVINLREDVPYLGFLKLKVAGANGLCLMNSDPNEPSQGQISLKSCSAANNSQFRWAYFRRPAQIQPVSNDEACIDYKHPHTSSWCESSKSVKWTVQRLSSEGDGDVVLIRTSNSTEPGSESVCLSTNSTHTQVFTAKCDENSDHQRWHWTRYNPPKIWTPVPRQQQQ